MKLRTPYGYDVNKASDEAGLKCMDKSRTQKHHKDECDINTIVERFGLTGELPDNIRMPRYGDFTEVTNYHEALNAVAKARENFDLLPAKIRAQFHNDPGEFVDFASDPANGKALVDMGLAIKRPEPPPETPPAPPPGGQTPA